MSLERLPLARKCASRWRRLFENLFKKTCWEKAGSAAWSGGKDDVDGTVDNRGSGSVNEQRKRRGHDSPE